MAKVKVTVLFPQAFTAAGVEVYKQKDGRDVQLDQVEVDSALAESLVAAGYAEKSK